MAKSLYHPELIEMIVKEYLPKDARSIELANKYNITSDKTVYVWE